MKQNKRVKTMLTDGLDKADAIDAVLATIKDGELLIEPVWGLGILIAWDTEHGLVWRLVDPDIATDMGCALIEAARVSKED